MGLYADRKNDIAVVLTDMMMPFMDGPATIRALQKMNPAIKIIAASGLTAGHKPGEASLEGVKVFLSKPYTAEKLLKALAESLILAVETSLESKPSERDYPTIECFYSRCEKSSATPWQRFSRSPTAHALRTHQLVNRSELIGPIGWSVL